MKYAMSTIFPLFGATDLLGLLAATNAQNKKKGQPVTKGDISKEFPNLPKAVTDSIPDGKLLSRLKNASFLDGNRPKENGLDGVEVVKDDPKDRQYKIDSKSVLNAIKKMMTWLGAIFGAAKLNEADKKELDQAFTKGMKLAQ